MSYIIAVLARSAREQEDTMKKWKKTKNIELTKEVDQSVSNVCLLYHIFDLRLNIFTYS
jgi:predicted GIY-YIG superfamily endonuclease